MVVTWTSAAAHVGQRGDERRACRRSRAGTRGTSRAGSGTTRTERRPPADPPRACAAARAAPACRAVVLAAAAIWRRSRGTSRRRAPCRQADRRRAPGRDRGRAQTARDPAAHPHPDTAPRIHRRPTASRRRRPCGRESRRRPPWPMARGCGRPAARARRFSSRRDRRGRARSRWSRRRAVRPSRRSDRAGIEEDALRRAGRRSWSLVRRAAAAAGGMRDRSRINRPIVRPSSRGRPARSPFQKGILPGWPGAGETSTRSWVISSMRQDEAPRTKTSPTRLSKTISSSSSPTRVRRRARRRGRRRTGRDRGSFRHW